MNINYYNPYVREELMLYHHGVLGQKHGVRNGPPYPLAAGAHSASEKKAGWKKSLYADGKSTHFSKKVEKYVFKSEKKGFNARRGKKALNLIERQKAKDTYQKRIAERKGDKEKAAISEKRIKAGERKANEIIKNLNDNGYTVSSAKVLRDATYGKKVAFRMLANDSPAIPALHTLYRRGANVVEGNRYKVKGGKSGERYAQKLTNPNRKVKDLTKNKGLRYKLHYAYSAIGGPSQLNRVSSYQLAGKSNNNRLKERG